MVMSAKFVDFKDWQRTYVAGLLSWKERIHLPRSWYETQVFVVNIYQSCFTTVIEELVSRVFDFWNIKETVICQYLLHHSSRFHVDAGTRHEQFLSSARRCLNERNRLLWETISRYPSVARDLIIFCLTSDKHARKESLLPNVSHCCELWSRVWVVGTLMTEMWEACLNQGSVLGCDATFCFSTCFVRPCSCF